MAISLSSLPVLTSSLTFVYWSSSTLSPKPTSPHYVPNLLKLAPMASIPLLYEVIFFSLAQIITLDLHVYQYMQLGLHECLINVTNSPGPLIFSSKIAPFSFSIFQWKKPGNWQSSKTFIFSIPEPINHKIHKILLSSWFSQLCTICPLHCPHSFQIIISTEILQGLLNSSIEVFSCHPYTQSHFPYLL